MSGSTVLYKFKSSTDQHTVHFEGPHIALNELRAAIVQEHHIVKGRDFFLLELSNAQTGEVYGEDGLIGRNTAVLVKRVPLQRREAIESKGGETDLDAAAKSLSAPAEGDEAGSTGNEAGNAAPAAEPEPPPAVSYVPPTFGGQYGQQLIDPLSGTVFEDAVITTCCGTSFSKEVRQRQQPRSCVAAPTSPSLCYRAACAHAHARQPPLTCPLHARVRLAASLEAR